VQCVPAELKCSSTLGREVTGVNVCGLLTPLSEKNPVVLQSLMKRTFTGKIPKSRISMCGALKTCCIK